MKDKTAALIVIVVFLFCMFLGLWRNSRFF